MHRLAGLVTSTTAPVYALTEALPSAIAAAAMARLSRCGDDLRQILLREFLDSSTLPGPVVPVGSGKEQGLLRRVITAYGDDSVQQLAGLYVVVEGASNLLTKSLERPRVGAAFLEQSTRYIYFDSQVGDPPRYRYVIPAEVQDRDKYCAAMDKLFDRYSTVVHRLTEHLTKRSQEPLEKRDAAWRSAVRAQACDAARCLLPTATSSTVGIYASAQALDSLIMHLNGSPLAEARSTGGAMLAAVRQVAPLFFERTDLPDRGQATTAYLRETADQVQDHCLASGFQPSRLSKSTELIDYWPLDERRLMNSLAFASGYQCDQITTEEFAKLVSAYAGERLNRRHKLGRAIEAAHYTFQHRTAYAEFRDLQRHRLVDGLEWRLLRADSDWELPELANSAGLADHYHQSFTESAQLYQWLCTAHGKHIGQYATLLGHKIDWQWTMNLREATHIVELRSTPQGHPGYRAIAQQIYAEISRVHPILASTIKFVNCGEDPELGRLAAERAAAFKLKQLQ